MRQLHDDPHLILDGEVRVYRRERSQQTLPLCHQPNSIITHRNTLARAPARVA